MALISKPNFGELVEAERWDAETYTPLLRALDVRFRNEPTLVSLATVTHPTEIPRIYDIPRPASQSFPGLAFQGLARSDLFLLSGRVNSRLRH
jgi:hypothetical protein